MQFNSYVCIFAFLPPWFEPRLAMGNRRSEGSFDYTRHW